MDSPDLVVHANLELCSLGFALAICIQRKTCLCLLSDIILQASDLFLCWLYHISAKRSMVSSHSRCALLFLQQDM